MDSVREGDHSAGGTRVQVFARIPYLFRNFDR